MLKKIGWQLADWQRTWIVFETVFGQSCPLAFIVDSSRVFLITVRITSPCKGKK